MSFLDFAVLAILALAASGTAPQSYAVLGDAIAQPLSRTPGNAARGRAIVASRTQGLCLLCHSAPVPEERLQGNLAPSLAGVGSRLSAGQIRLRIVEASRVNPNSIMPSYFRAGDPPRTARAWAGKTLLTAEQVEDVVAFLTTLRD